MSSSQPGTCPCQGAAGRPAILYALLSPSLRARPSVPPRSESLPVQTAPACPAVCPASHLPGSLGCSGQDSRLPQEPAILLPAASSGSAAAVAGLLGSPLPAGVGPRRCDFRGGRGTGSQHTQEDLAGGAQEQSRQWPAARSAPALTGCGTVASVLPGVLLEPEAGPQGICLPERDHHLQSW